MNDNVIEMAAPGSARVVGGSRRKGFYDRIAKRSIAPLWEVLRGIAPNEPVTALAAHVWRWEECRSYLIEAGDLLSAEEAERRGMLLAVPGRGGRARTTGNLTGAFQLVLTGDVGPGDRHAHNV